MLYVIPNCICSVYVIYLCPINVLILSDLRRVFLPYVRLLLWLLLLLLSPSPGGRRFRGLERPGRWRSAQGLRCHLTGQLPLSSWLKSCTTASHSLTWQCFKRFLSSRFLWTGSLTWGCGLDRPMDCQFNSLPVYVDNVAHVLPLCQNSTSLSVHLAHWVLPVPWQSHSFGLLGPM